MGMIGNSLAQGLISGANIQDGTVDTPDIKDNAVTSEKLADNVSVSSLAVTGTVTADGLTVDGVSTFHGNSNAPLAWGDTTDAGYLSFDGYGNAVVRSATGARLNFQVNANRDVLSLQNGSTIFNESGLDQDFRVESDSSTHMLFVDAGKNAVGINTNSPKDDAVMEIKDGGLAGAAVLRVSADDNAPYAFIVGNDSHSTTTSHGLAQWMGSDGGARMDVRGGSNQYYEFRLGGTEVVKFHTDNGFVFNENGGDRDFRVESDSNSNAIFVDASANTVGLNVTGTVQTNFNSWLTGTNNELNVTIAAQPDYNSGVAYGGLKFRDAGWGSPVGTISMGVNSGDSTEKGYADQMRFTVKKSGGADINVHAMSVKPDRVDVHTDAGIYIKDGMPYYNVLRGTVTTDSNGYAEVGLAGWSWGTLAAFKRGGYLAIAFNNDSNEDQHYAFGYSGSVYFYTRQQIHFQGSNGGSSASIDLHANGSTGGRKIRFMNARASTTFNYVIKALPIADETWSYYGV